MLIPLIYSDKKFISVGDVITLTANTDHDIIWSFPNIDISKIEITDGAVSVNPISFKSLVDINPLIVKCAVIENDVQNSEHWTDSNLDGLADGWYGLPFGWQTNSIVTGWNFTGNSQRVVQANNFAPLLSQGGITVDGGDYSAELKYRSSKDVNMRLGGHDFALSATEHDTVAIFPILHNEGVVKFIQSGGSNPKWVLADGTFEYDDEFSKELSAGTSYLIVDDFNGVSIDSMNTNNVYVGDLSDVPNGISRLELENSGVVGNIASIDHITSIVNLGNTDVSGDIVSLSGVALIIDLDGCSSVYGELSALNASEGIILDNCSISGALLPSTSCDYWSLNNTQITKTDLSTSLVNLAAFASTSDIYDGYFECYDNMPTIDGSEGCTAIATLESYNWTVIVNSDCYWN